jgi:Right handed beta helix region
MGVIATSITSLGFALGLACVGLFAASEAGCSSASGRTPHAAGTTSTTSAQVTLSRVRRPRAPAPYRVPRRALHVSSSSELSAALSDGRRDTIVLAPGVYDNSEEFADREGDRIYASRLGRAVLRAGIALGGNNGPPGALIRGLNFSVNDPRKTLHGDVIHVWGSASGARVLDTWIDGHGVVDAGLVVHQPAGFVARRVVARRFLSYGIVVDPNNFNYTTAAPYSLRDLKIARVSRKVPGSSNGTAEACLWLGSRGTVQRVSVHNCAISGIWTGTAMKRSRIEDATIDRSRVGIYVEHFTTNTTFRRLRFGVGVTRGVNAEWANHAQGGLPASVDNVIEDAYFRTSHVGVYLDQGTTRTTVRHCVFVGQDWAGIGDFRGVDNQYYDNNFDGLAPGAVPVSYEHDPAGRARR